MSKKKTFLIFVGFVVGVILMVWPSVITPREISCEFVPSDTNCSIVIDKLWSTISLYSIGIGALLVAFIISLRIKNPLLRLVLTVASWVLLGGIALVFNFIIWSAE
jgi:hypothetical protein